MAVLLRLCDEDREKYGGPEWVRFDEDELDDLPFSMLHQFEMQMDTTLEYLLLVDKRTRMLRWTAARVWMARKLAGIDTPDFGKFDIKVRKVQVKEDKPEAADAGPPDSSPSSEAEASETESA